MEWAGAEGSSTGRLRDYYLTPAGPAAPIFDSLTFGLDFWKPNPGIDQKIPSHSDIVKQKTGGRTTERSATEKPAFKGYHETIHNVVHSRYTGVIPSHESTTAVLAVGQPADISNTTSGTILKWIQVERQYPSFNAFIEYVSQLEILDEDAKQEVDALLRGVRDRHEKTLHMPGGKRGKFLECNLTQRVLDHSSISKHSRDIEVGRQRKAILLCMPYFSLAPYAANSSSHAPEFHPTRTLLQSSYISTPKERDLQQAVCNLENSMKGFCFHIPQIWCLIIRDNLLITCTNTPAPGIKRDLKGIKMVPMSKEDTEAHLNVSDGNGRVWLLPTRQSSTWLEFVANFKELCFDFESEYEVLLNGTVKDADSWSSVIERAKRTAVYLVIRHKRLIKEKDKDDLFDASTRSFHELGASSESLQSDSTKQPFPKNGKSRAAADKVFQASLDAPHLFMWFAALPDEEELVREEHCEATASGQGVQTDQDVNAPDNFNVDLTMLDRKFLEMHRCLSSERFIKHCEYRVCPVHTVQELDASLSQISQKQKKRIQELRKDISTSERQDSVFIESPERINIEKQLAYQKKIVSIAKTLFQLFLPLEFSWEMVGKYWGAVKDLIEHCDVLETMLERTSSETTSSMRLARIVTRDLSRGRAPLPWKFTLPSFFMEAWPHLVMFFVLSRAGQHQKGFNEIATFRVVIKRGRLDMMNNLAQGSIHQREAALSFGVTSLVIKNFLADVTINQRDSLSTYSEYLEKLEQELVSRPYSRGHQEKLLKFRQEVASVLNVLEDQLSCVDTLTYQVVKGPTWPSYNSHGLPQAREEYVLNACIRSLEARIESFSEMNEYAAHLVSSNMVRIESNKDRQEAAILIFTAVTVLFLPLSFVTSFLGMNTSDIRNMNTKQWIFWASAIPLAIFVVGLALVTIRHVDPVRQAWSEFTSPREGVRPQEESSPSPRRRRHRKYSSHGAYDQSSEYSSPIPGHARRDHSYGRRRGRDLSSEDSTFDKGQGSRSRRPLPPPMPDVPTTSVQPLHEYPRRRNRPYYM